MDMYIVVSISLCMYTSIYSNHCLVSCLFVYVFTSHDDYMVC